MAPIRDAAGTVRPERTRWRPAAPSRASSPKRRNALKEIDGFGANPGSLRMLAYVPVDLPPGAPLVVVLHGCAQDARGYEAHAGWTALADELGFAVLYPEQPRRNNPAGCFNWFLQADSVRGLGEARSIREMIATLSETAGLDASRVYVTGLSAGGAMATALLAAYPDVFAAGAVIAGLPCGAAAGVKEALDAMTSPSARTDAELGDAVRAGAPYDGPWPRISIWHGLADRTVSPANADQLVRQWLDVHGLEAEAYEEHRSGGRLRRVWRRDGRDLVELTTIDGMGHGAPLDGARGERGGPFMLDVGVSSTRAIGDFFELSERPRAVAAAPAENAASTKASKTSSAPVSNASAPAVRAETARPAALAGGKTRKREAKQSDASSEKDAGRSASRPTKPATRPQTTQPPSPDGSSALQKSASADGSAAPAVEGAPRAPDPKRVAEADRKTRPAAIVGAGDPEKPAPPSSPTGSTASSAPPRETVVSIEAARRDRNRTAFDVGQAIRKALKAAGLMR